MTDLKPEDLVAIRETMEGLGVAGSSLTERHRKLLIAGRDAISDLLWEHDALLADRARMEKALRETTDALLNAAAALEQLQESSENGAESIKTIGSADPGVTVHMFGLLADSARRAAKYAREGASQ